MVFFQCDHHHARFSVVFFGLGLGLESEIAVLFLILILGFARETTTATTAEDARAAVVPGYRIRIGI